MAPLPSFKLNDGHFIPFLGYGTGTAWYKSNFDAPLDRTLVESIKTAIQLGYTHLDGAEIYNTEPELGAAIKESRVPREDLFVTTKVDHGINDIPAAFAASLRKLQLDYVDLYLIHEPFFAKSPQELQKVWRDMEGIHKSGKAKSIGVSNYQIEHLAATLETASVPPAINQIEYHPYLQQKELIAFHEKHNITIQAYGPLTAITKAKPGPSDDVIAKVAKSHGVSEGEVSLRWCIEQGILPITTSSKESRLREYLGVTNFQLTGAEVAEIAKSGGGKHFRGFWKGKVEK